MAWLGRDPSREWDAAYSALLAETAALENAYGAERVELERLTTRFRAQFSDEVLPALDQISQEIDDEGGAMPDAGDTLAALAVVADHFGCAPVFDDLAAFEDFMADPGTTLSLRIEDR